MKKNWLLWSALALILAGCDDVSVDDTCHSSDDCANGFECLNGQCKFDVVKDCNQKCQQGTCNANGVCVTEGECSKTAIQCDKDGQSVVLVCADNKSFSLMDVLEECSGGQRCLESDGKAFCGECGSDEACLDNETGKKCNSEHRCVQCIDDASCGDNFICNSSWQCVSAQTGSSGGDKECELSVECDEDVPDSLTVKCNGDEVDVIPCPHGCMTVQSEGQKEMGVCKSEETETDPKCQSYELACSAENGFIDLKCDGELYKDKMIQCKADEDCEAGKCVTKPKPDAECENPEWIKTEINQTLSTLELQEPGFAEKCGKYVMHAGDNSAFDEAKKIESSCLVICGAVGVSDSDNEKGYDLGNIKYVIGINHAVIRSNSENNELTHPLFSEINGSKIANLELDYTLSVRKGLKENIGMLAGKSNNSNYIDIKISNRSIRNNNQTIKNLGLLLGSSNSDELVNININAASIDLDTPSEYVICGDHKSHANIGGLIGYAQGGKIKEPHISDLAINAGYGERIGGLVGSAKNIEIIGSDNSSQFDVSKVTIQNAERNAGGLFGQFSGEKNSINNIIASIDRVESMMTSTGGIIGFLYDNSKVEINNIDVDIDKIIGGRYVGGVVGFSRKSELTIDNAAVKSNVISAQDSCNSSEANGHFAGGVVGAVADNSTLSISSVYNTFARISAVSSAGGVFGGISYGSGNISIEDVINRNVDGKGVAVSDKYAGGLIGTVVHSNAKTNKLNIKNIFSEVNSVRSNNYAGGLVSYIHANSDTTDEQGISNVISYGQIYTNGYGGGLVGELRLPDNVKINFGINNILVSGSVTLNIEVSGNNTADKAKNLTIGGMVYKIDYWKNNNSKKLISNALINVDVKEKENNSYFNKVAHTITHDDATTVCPGVDYNLDDNYSGTNGKNKLNSKYNVEKIFDKVYYTFVGLNCDGNCSDQGDYIGHFDYSKVAYIDPMINTLLCFGSNNGTCDKYKDQNRPIRSCWFNDYVYLKDTKKFNGQWSDFYTPILPYHPYSCKEEDPTKCQPPCSDTVTANCIDTKNSPNNIQDVLESLNKENTTSWTQCDNLQFENKDIQFDPKIYPYLLCPVLTGKTYTSMKTKK